MSTVPVSNLSDNSSSSAPAQQQVNVVPIVSATLAKAVYAELLLNPHALSDAVKTTLAACDQEQIKAALERMKVFVDISALVMTAMRSQEAERRQAALNFCVVRGANYVLLHKLFRVSRYEVQELRRQLRVEAATRPKIIIEGLDDIYRDWGTVCGKYESEVDRWISLAKAYPQHGLNSLYQVIVHDGGA